MTTVAATVSVDVLFVAVSRAQARLGTMNGETTRRALVADLVAAGLPADPLEAVAVAVMAGGDAVCTRPHDAPTAEHRSLAREILAAV